jgi:uncharacterized protein RhaS with RHS repeats
MIPSFGRETSPDPIGFSGGDGNLYAYVGGDPVNGVDVDGLRLQVTPSGGPVNAFPSCLAYRESESWVDWFWCQSELGSVLPSGGSVVFRGEGAMLREATLYRSALQSHKGQALTRVGRELTKHPDVVNLTKETLRQSLRTDPAINQATASALKEILRTGIRTSETLPRFGEVIQYKIPGGFGARWYAAGDQIGQFIGFIGP